MLSTPQKKSGWKRNKKSFTELFTAEARPSTKLKMRGYDEISARGETCMMDVRSRTDCLWYIG